MREREFICLLNSEDNRDNNHTGEILARFISEGYKQNGLEERRTFFRRIFRWKSKKANKIIAENMGFIVRKLDGKYSTIEPILELYDKEEELRPVIREYYNKIVRQIVERASEDELPSIIKKLKDRDVTTDIYLNQRLEEITISYMYNLFDTAQLLKNRDLQFDEKINKKLEENKVEIARALIYKAVCGRNSNYINVKIPSKENGMQVAKDYAETLTIMIDEILKSEGKRWIDINVIPGGKYSDVFEIGGKIIKVGIPRQTYNIPYHRRILQPLIRINFDIKGQYIACVEVCEKVDLNIEEDKKEVVYRVWKELREEGIIWADPKPENIGILLKDNIPLLDEEETWSDEKATGIQAKKDRDILKKGEYVIIDTDYVLYIRR